MWHLAGRPRDLVVDTLISAFTPILMLILAQWIGTKLDDMGGVDWVIEMHILLWGRRLGSIGVYAWLGYAIAYAVIGRRVSEEKYQKMRLFNAVVPSGAVCPFGIIATIITVVSTTPHSLN